MENFQAKFVVNAEGFTRHLNHRDAPIWWGIVGLILIELSVVAAFTVSYIYLRMMNQVWPPAGVDLPDPTLATLSLCLLLVSCGSMYLSGKCLEQGKVRSFVIYTLISVGLASLVLVLRWLQFSTFEMTWYDHVYGSLLWTISGFHFTHVVSAVIGTLAIALFGMTGFFTKKRQIGVVVDTMYWNFVALAWIPFYLVLYFVPRI